jgi:AraC-like DNA-binding protein
LWPVVPGQQRLDGGRQVLRHRHRHAYAAVVLSGGYEEAGDHGRWRVGAGQAVIHDRFEAHQDRVDPRGSKVLNLPLTGRGPGPGAYRVADVDLVACLAERDPREAAALLLSQPLTPVDPCRDWPDLLAADLREGRCRAISGWAAAQRLCPATVSRGFRRTFGISPKRYRLEAQLGRAVRMLQNGATQLAFVAYACGFADQSHLTRAMRQLVGLTPAHLRRSSSFKKSEAGSDSSP